MNLYMESAKYYLQHYPDQFIGHMDRVVNDLLPKLNQFDYLATMFAKLGDSQVVKELQSLEIDQKNEMRNLFFDVYKYFQLIGKQSYLNNPDKYFRDIKKLSEAMRAVGA